MADSALLFKTADEFMKRENYVPDLRCGGDELDKIVGKYAFSEQHRLQCGLNGCRRWHWHGYVIQTKDGREGHCGQDCGKREFGVSFDEIEATFQREEAAAARRTVIQEMLSVRGELLAAATTLYSTAATSRSKIEEVLTEVAKDGALMIAMQSCLRNEGRIQVAATVDKDMRRAMGTVDRRADIETIGVIAGGEALTMRDTVVRELDFRVLRELKGLGQIQLDAMSEKDLQEQSLRLREMRDTLQKAQQFVDAASQFFARRNLEEFSKLREILSQRDRTARVERILTRLPDIFAR
ncbi:V-type ATPase 116kDa subunit family protein [Pandoraea sputorum]|uniref:V-type ATPase 116kDa subunit family protein n=1 Tax=Pandoraea sputorum TaxID=93222 RepID=UPI00123FE248|nr:V-type ATPase 116kDa subunit family protein [Pandoraea sputorum]VVE07132.1 hypothetical protein PSP20601_02453 [Pandoraea sputorum]